MSTNIQKDPNTQSIIIHPKAKPIGTLIWLHGRAQNSQKYAQLFINSQFVIYDKFKIKILNASERAITIQKGRIVRAWYDVKKSNRFQGDQKQIFNFDDIKNSSLDIKKHVIEQINFYKNLYKSNRIQPHRRVFLGGFSQGAVMSIYNGMQQDLLGGIVSVGGYSFRNIDYKNIGKMPILLIHGSKDKMIEENSAKVSYQKILDKAQTKYVSILGMTHIVNNEAIKQIKKWLQTNSQLNYDTIKPKL